MDEFDELYNQQNTPPWGGAPNYMTPKMASVQTVGGYPVPSLNKAPLQYVKNPYAENEFEKQPSAGSSPGMMGIAGLPTGLLNLGLGISQLAKARKVKPIDTVPSQLREAAGDLRLRSASSKVGNYSQALDRITNRENTAFGNAMSAVTSPSQAVQAASNIQRGSNLAEMELGDRGQQLQQYNLGQYRDVSGRVGEWENRDIQDAARKKAALQEAGWRNIGNFTNTAGQAALGFL